MATSPPASPPPPARPPPTSCSTSGGAWWTPPLPPPATIAHSDAADVWGRPVRGWVGGGGRPSGGGGGHGRHPAWHGSAQGWDGTRVPARHKARRARTPPEFAGGGAPPVPVSAADAHGGKWSTPGPRHGRRVRTKGEARRNAAEKARRAAEARRAGGLTTDCTDVCGERAVDNGDIVPLDAANAAARCEVGGGGGAWGRARRTADSDEYNPADYEDGHTSPEVRRVRDGKGGQAGSRRTRCRRVEDDEDWVRASDSEEEEDKSSERTQSHTLTSGSSRRSWDYDTRPRTPLDDMVDAWWEDEKREEAAEEEEGDAYAGYGSGERGRHDGPHDLRHYENDE